MRLADINTIRLGNPRTVGYDYERNVPTSLLQRQKIDIDQEAEWDDEDQGDVEDVEKDVEELVDLVSMSGSWTPKKNLPDIRRLPNTSNLL